MDFEIGDMVYIISNNGKFANKITIVVTCAKNVIRVYFNYKKGKRNFAIHKRDAVLVKRGNG